MKHLFRGHQSQKRIELLLSLTSIKSEPTIDAIYDYLCKGHDLKIAASLNDVSSTNLSRSLTILDQVAGTVEQIKDLDWSKFIAA